MTVTLTERESLGELPFKGEQFEFSLIQQS